MYAIKFENVSKAYKLYDKPLDRLKESINLFGKKYHKIFYAVKDISFEIRKGEPVGIIGENGSGKSTILKLIAGVLSPTSGQVSVNGKISALLELGAGFNPEFTGIENIYLYGTILGYCREEMDRKIDEILSFADIGDFVYRPVKMYSSGMFARLAFAVATHVDPDILIVDEVLSVGDMYFQEKCINKMKSFKRNGTTILYVSHGLASIRNFCERVMWVDDGKIVADGPSSRVCEAYQDFIASKQITLHKDNPVYEVVKPQKVVIRKVITDKSLYMTGDNIEIGVEIDFIEDIGKYALGIIIFNVSGDIVTLFNTMRDDIILDKQHKKIMLYIPSNDFVRGTYYISVSVTDECGLFPYAKLEFGASFFVDIQKNSLGLPIAEGYFRAKHDWKIIG